MSEKKKVTLKAIKVGLLGDSQVGKTAICRSLLKFEFDPDVLSTIGNIKFDTKFELKNGEKIKLILWDSAGQERFRSVAMTTLKAVMGIVLVFDVTMKESFDNVNDWLDQIKDNLNDPCLVLFANKIDIDKKFWKISEEEIEDFAKEKNMVYFNTSAKNNEGIVEGFQYLVNEIYERVKGKDEEEKEENIKPNIVIEPTIELKKDEESEEETKTGCFGKKKKKKKKKKEQHEDKNKEKVK
jgi:small GTP-binding protein